MKANIVLRRTLVALACLGAAAGAVQAAEADEMAQLPPVERQGGVEFLSGGVGTDAALALEREGRHYQVHATFAGKTLQRELAVRAGAPQHDLFLWPQGYRDRAA